MEPIDISVYANRTVDFIVNGKLVKCPELSYKDMKRINEYENNDNATQKDELEMVLFLLNRNTEGIKFNEEQIYDLPAGAITRIYQECVLLSRKALVDPN